MLIFIGDKYELEDMSGEIGKLKVERKYLMVVISSIIILHSMVLLYVFVIGFYHLTS